MELADLTAVVGAVVSVVAALLALWFQRGANVASKEANRIQASLLELERKRETRERQASVRADFAVTLQPQGDFTDVVVTNLGPGEALDVHISFLGGSRPIEAFVRKPPEMPVPLLRPGANVSLRVRAPREIAGGWVSPVVVEWKYQDGLRDRFRTDVS